METINITPQLLEENFNNNIDNAEEYITSLLPQNPKIPQKPILKENHSAEDVKEYAVLLEKYETNQLKFKEEKEIYNNRKKELFQIFDEYIKEINGFYNVVPKLHQQKVWEKAWRDGHSIGYTQVSYELNDLIDLFE